jgi:hypothetical protein
VNGRRSMVPGDELMAPSYVVPTWEDYGPPSIYGPSNEYTGLRKRRRAYAEGPSLPGRSGADSIYADDKSMDDDFSRRQFEMAQQGLEYLPAESMDPWAIQSRGQEALDWMAQARGERRPPLTKEEERRWVDMLRGPSR